MTENPGPATICPVCLAAICEPGHRRCGDCAPAFDARNRKFKP